MSQQWLYGKDKQGPVSSVELKDLANLGQIAPTDMIWKLGGTKCVPASKVKGLFPKTSLRAPWWALAISACLVFAVAGFWMRHAPVKQPQQDVIEQPLLSTTAPPVKPPGEKPVAMPVVESGYKPLPVVEPTHKPSYILSMAEERRESPNLVDLLKDNKVRIAKMTYDYNSFVTNVVLEPAMGTTLPKYVVPCGTMLRTPNSIRQNLMVMRTCESSSNKLRLEICCINKNKKPPQGIYGFERLPPSDPIVEEAKRLETHKMSGCNMRCKQDAMWVVTEALRAKGIEK